MLELADTLQRRVEQNKAAREGILIEMAGLRRRQGLPVNRILPSQVQTFSKVIFAKLQGRSSTLAREYLRAVVGEIVIRDGTATISGSHAKLMHAVASKKLPADQVPSFIPKWCAPAVVLPVKSVSSD